MPGPLACRPLVSAQPWPQLAACGCGSLVLRVRHPGAGRPFAVEADPILPGPEPCGSCRGTGSQWVRLASEKPGRSGRPPALHPQEIGAYVGATTRRQVDCLACHGTGVRGELPDRDCLLVDSDGIARPYQGEHPRWHALHRRHRCPR